MKEITIETSAPSEEAVRAYVRARWPGAIEHLDKTGHKVTCVNEAVDPRHGRSDPARWYCEICEGRATDLDGPDLIEIEFL